MTTGMGYAKIIDLHRSKRKHEVKDCRQCGKSLKGDKHIVSKRGRYHRFHYCMGCAKLLKII